MRIYTEYKNVKDSFITQIPMVWEFKRLQYIAEIENSGIWGEDDPFDYSVKVKIPTTAQLTIDGNWKVNEMTYRHISEVEWDHYKVVEGDIIVVKSSGSAANIITGKCGFIKITEEGKFSFGNFLLRVRPTAIVPKLLYYFLGSKITKERIEKIVSATTYPNLKVDEYSKSLVPVPPLSEQSQIVAYLDRKTALIDALIEKTERKIALLKEKRTALINQAVTKGLDPNVPMKDSGVEWIGEIPEHWGVVQLKYQFKVNGGATPSTNNAAYWNGEIPWVSSKDMKVKYITETQDYISELGLKESSCSLIEIDSMIIVVRSGILRRTIPVAINKVPLAVNQDQKALRPIKDINVEMLYYYVKGFENILLQSGTKQGATVESIDMDEFLNSKLLMPPLREQDAIVQFLETECGKIDSICTIEEKRIQKLKEYRQALISEVVTGKLKVSQDD